MDEFEYQNVIKHLGNYIDDLNDQISKLKGEIFDMKIKANGLEDVDPFADCFPINEDQVWKLVNKERKAAPAKKRGRPVGSKNKSKTKGKVGRPKKVK